MAMKQCPVCGEKYSDTYRDCPFCEEEEALQKGTKVRRGSRSKRGGRQSQPSFLSPILVAVVVLLAALLVYLLFGDQIAERFFSKNGENTPGVEEPAADDVTPQEPELPGAGEDTMDPGIDYAAVEALPDGLTLSMEDFTLRELGETHTIEVSGGGTYQWVSEDPSVASVDQNGVVKAISAGTVRILATDGVKKGACIVRCNVTGTLAQEPDTPDDGSTAAGSGTLRTGSAVIINGGNGVRVRSGPGTSYEVLATVPDGAAVKITENAGNDWYRVTYAGIGGADAEGYIKGEFLKNS